MAASAEQHVFSTGKLRIGPVGATLSDADHGIGCNQGAQLDIAYQKKDLYCAAQNSQFPVDTAHYQGKATLQVNTADWNRDLWSRLFGLVASTSGGIDTYTVTKTTKPQFLKVEFEGIDTAGKMVKMTFFKAINLGLSAPFGIEDFSFPQINFEGYPDSNGDVCAIAMAQ